MEDFLSGLETSKINKIIENIASHLDDDTVLVVLGDHGMTDSVCCHISLIIQYLQQGEHGGDSELETDSALFFYSTQSFVSARGLSLSNAMLTSIDRLFVNQVDLTPTLALLLGCPIPKNNIVGCHKVFISNAPGSRHS